MICTKPNIQRNIHISIVAVKITMVELMMEISRVQYLRIFFNYLLEPRMCESWIQSYHDHMDSKNYRI